MLLSGIFFVSLHHQSNRMTMFKKTDPNPQLDIFTAPSMQLGSRASKKYSDPNAWHNQFYSLVTTKIDEEIFKPLFPEGKKSGRPNASIRILVAMSVLKEGFGCSDEDLFEKCEFDLLARIGNFIMEMLAAFPATSPAHDLLQRLFDEQYVVMDGKAVLRDKKEVKADSLQNPNDPDATYRSKNDQKVQGYVTNITETVEEGKPNIITSVQVETAVFADCHFLQEAVENSERVTDSTIKDLYADGAYQSPDNREFAKNHNAMQLKTGKMQGGCRWKLIPHDEDGLTIREIATGNTYEAVKAVTKQGSRKRWRIPWNNKTGWRYFEDKDIKAYQLRKQIESLPLEEQHKRNNVEAAMFQYSFHTRNGKTRYRGLLKHRMHAYSRCMWMNLRRMVIFQISTFQRSIFALFGPIREAFGSFKAISRKIFTSGADCYVSLRMTTLVRLDSKYAPF